MSAVEKCSPPIDEVADWIRSNAIELATADPGGTLDDLEPLRPILADARVVSLGEATHGTREFFQLKHRILRFCVERLGFTVFGIEANYPEGLRVNDYVLNGRGNAADAIEGMRFWTWATKEVLALVEWMRAWNETHQRKIKFYGFDAQFPASAALGTLDYLARVRPDVAASVEPAIGCLTSDFTAHNFQFMAAAERNEALACIERILALFASERDDWVRATSDLDWHLGRLHAVVLHQATLGWAADPMDAFAMRDRAMAENVRALLEAEGPEAKAVVWAHNGHVQRCPIPEYRTSMGGHLSAFFGSEHVIAGFAFNQGSFRAMHLEQRKLVVHTIPPAAATLDLALAQSAPPLSAFDLRGARIVEPVARWLATKPASRFIGAVYSDTEAERFLIRADPLTNFDILLFVETTTAARDLQQETGFVAVAPEIVEPQPTNLAMTGEGRVPDAWRASPTCRLCHTVAIADERTPSGGVAVCIATREAPWLASEGSLKQTFAAEPWRGKRLRLVASIRAETEGYGSGAQLAINVRGTPKEGEKAGFDGTIVIASMAERSVRSASWATHSLECDIPHNAERIDVSFLSSGRSTGWFGDLDISAVRMAPSDDGPTAG